MADVKQIPDAKRFARACDAADALLAPICAAIGRYLYDAPDSDLIAALADYDVVIPAKVFRELYDATDRTRE